MMINRLAALACAIFTLGVTVMILDDNTIDYNAKPTVAAWAPLASPALPAPESIDIPQADEQADPAALKMTEVKTTPHVPQRNYDMM